MIWPFSKTLSNKLDMMLWTVGGKMQSTVGGCARVMSSLFALKNWLWGEQVGSKAVGWAIDGEGLENSPISS